MSIHRNYATRATHRRCVVSACLWSLAIAAACDAASSGPGTASSVSAVASRAPGLHEKSLGSPAVRVGGVRVEEAMEAYTRFEKACRSRDANAVWAELAPGGQADVEERAKVLYEQANAAEQERLSKLAGEPDIFSLQEYLISQFERPDSTCPKGEWTLTDKQEYHELFLMVRHAGEACEGLWFARTEGKVGVFPAGWYDSCPDNPAARVIADVGQRGKKLREEQQRVEQAKGEPVPPAQVRRAYEAYTKACKTKDVDAMWRLLPEKRRQWFDNDAAEYRQSKDLTAVLKEDGWLGDVANYDGPAHFARRLEAVGFCPEGPEWTLIASSRTPESPGWVVVRATGSRTRKCGILEVTLDNRSPTAVQISPRWSSKCPPEVSLAELLKE